MRFIASVLLLLLAAAAYAIDPPAPCEVVESGQPGPTVIVYAPAGEGGFAGAYAVEAMRHWRLARGRLILELVQSNAEELAGRAAPTSTLDYQAPAFDSAYRLFLRDEVSASGEAPSSRSTLSVQTAKANQPLAAGVLASINAALPSGASPCVQRDWNDEVLRPVHPFKLVFTTAAPQLTPAVRARQHRICAHALLASLQMLAPDVTLETIIDPAQPTRVAVFDGAGSAGAGVPNVLAQLRGQPGVAVARICAEDIAAGALGQFTVAMFTGGSGSKQAGTLGEAGRALVQEFVRGGGGYIGICAGSYLACEGFTWGLGILNAKTASPKWRRGHGTVKVELNERGQSLLGARGGELDCRYGNGPILRPAGDSALPEFEVLASFRTELAENNTPKGLMVNSPAIVCATCGKGRVLCISPHPEQTPGLEDMVPRAVTWVAAHSEGQP